MSAMVEELRQPKVPIESADDGESVPNAKRANGIDAHVGNRLKMRRLVLRLSQERLGEIMGLTFQQIQKYEKGQNRISAGRLYLFAQSLDVAINYFFEGLHVEARSDGVPGMADGGANVFTMDFMSTKEGVELNRAFAAIDDPDVRRRIVDLAQAIAKGGDKPKS